MTDFVKVTAENLPELAELASEIWHEYWTIILTDDQIDYMVENFQSLSAIKKQIAEENYSYYFINEDGKNIGYFGILNKTNYMFLSKFYILKEYRHKGLGKKTFQKIKELTLKNKINTIKLTVNKYNSDTIAAYKKWGFETTDAVVTDIGSGFVMDDYIMEYYL